ncbi:MAG: methyl-accepting chemotaxis protein [Pseudomonadota bacterium]
MTRSHHIAPENVLAFAALALVPLVAFASWMAGNGVVVAPTVAAGFAGLGLAALKLEGRMRKPLVGLALIGQPIALTAALTGHHWQIDMHMTFFAALAILVALSDVRTIVAGTVAITVHHLSLSVFMPALVYPGAELSAALGRTVVHAVVVLIEAAALIATIARINRLGAERKAQLAEARDASAAEEQARHSAEMATQEAEESRNAADTARMEAEASLARLEEERQEAARSHARAEAAECAERRAQATQMKNQQMVVDALRAALGRMAEGDLTARLDTRFEASYEEVRHAYNKTVERLADTIGQVTTAAEKILVDTGGISQAASDLSQRTERQATKLEQTAAALEELTSLVRSAADRAGDASNSAASAQTNAEGSGMVVGKASDAMASIDGSANEINKIIDVIDQIAFQTNLLALNAGVEAARAGDAGRGFAVVASEVRALAQRSSDAAAEINQLIDRSQDQVREGVLNVGRTVDALRTVIDEVTGISGQIREISTSASEQAMGLDEINRAVNELDSVTQQNAGMFEETSAAATELNASARDLLELTGQFRLPEMRGPALIVAS